MTPPLSLHVHVPYYYVAQYNAYCMCNHMQITALISSADLHIALSRYNHYTFYHPLQSLHNDNVGELCNSVHICISLVLPRYKLKFQKQINYAAYLYLDCPICYSFVDMVTNEYGLTSFSHALLLPS